MAAPGAGLRDRANGTKLLDRAPTRRILVKEGTVIPRDHVYTTPISPKIRPAQMPPTPQVSGASAPFLSAAFDEAIFAA